MSDPAPETIIRQACARLVAQDSWEKPYADAALAALDALVSALRAKDEENKRLREALADDGDMFGDAAIEDVVSAYLEHSDWGDHAASCTVVDEARQAGRDARAARRARAALAAAQEPPAEAEAT